MSTNPTAGVSRRWSALLTFSFALAVGCSRPSPATKRALPSATTSASASTQAGCTSPGCRESGPWQSHADCAKSAACRTDGRCFLAPNAGDESSCIAAELHVAQRLPLTEQRHAMSGELRVLLDSRLPASTLEDARGYSPAIGEPMAAASVRLQNTAGTVLDELTLHPVLDVQSRSLGGGTDTLFVTEHVACLSGRFCGWHTQLFELRSGKFQRLVAHESGGAERAVVVTASLAARWSLRPDSTKRGVELISQEEDPEKSAWVERRFFYADGGFRYSEREAPTGDRKMLAEPGAWAGQLE